jgi:hypothetical protein
MMTGSSRSNGIWSMFACFNLVFFKRGWYSPFSMTFLKIVLSLVETCSNQTSFTIWSFNDATFVHKFYEISWNFLLLTLIVHLIRKRHRWYSRTDSWRAHTLVSITILIVAFKFTNCSIWSIKTGRDTTCRTVFWWLDLNISSVITTWSCSSCMNFINPASLRSTHIDLASAQFIWSIIINRVILNKHCGSNLHISEMKMCFFWLVKIQATPHPLIICSIFKHLLMKVIIEHFCICKKLLFCSSMRHHKLRRFRVPINLIFRISNHFLGWDLFLPLSI